MLLNTDLDYSPEQWATLLAGCDMPVYEELYAEYPYDELAPCPNPDMEYGDKTIKLPPERVAALRADIDSHHEETVAALAEKLTAPAVVVDQERTQILGLLETAVSS